MPKKTHKQNYIRNNNKVRDALFYFANQGIDPTNAQLAEYCNLTELTVAKHRTKENFKKLREDNKELFAVAPQIIDKIAEQALAGNEKSQDLFMKLVGLQEQIEVNVGENISDIIRERLEKIEKRKGK